MLDTSTVRERVPSVRMITEEEESVKRRAEALISRVKSSGDVLAFTIERSLSQIGGGALPGVGVPTWVIAVRSRILEDSSIERILRNRDIAVVARVEKGAVYLDLRTVLPQEERIVEEAINCVAEVARRKDRAARKGTPG